MQVPRQHLLAGAGFAGDQHRGLGPRDLLRPAHAGAHRRVAHDQGVGFARRRLENRRDQIRVRRQREEFLRAGADRAHRRLRVGGAAAGDHRQADPLAPERADEAADIVADLDQGEIDARGAAQPFDSGLGIVGLVEPRPARDRDPRRLAEIAGERADDQHAHEKILSRRARS